MGGLRLPIRKPEKLEDLKLTNREKQVIKHMLNGLSKKEIAEKMGITIHGVTAHRTNIRQKTGCGTVIQIFSKFKFKSE